MKYYLICNPGSRNSKSKALCEYYLGELHRTGIDLSYSYTKNLENASDLAKGAIRSGADVIVAVGGDGTINSVITGVLAIGSFNGAVGVLYSGTSPDFCKFHRIPTRPSSAVSTLLENTCRKVDACKIHFTGEDGKKRVSYFACSTNIGLGSGIASKSNRWRKTLGDTPGTLLATIATIAGAESFCAEITVDGKLHSFTNILNITVGKNPLIASGIKLKTPVQCDDGKMYMFAIRDKSKGHFILSLPQAYSGRLTSNNPESLIIAQKEIVIAPSSPVEIEFDGDHHGYCPATISIVHHALNLVVGNA